ncbi:unnamed protein product [Choristocarpus tenellus]
MTDQELFPRGKGTADAKKHGKSHHAADKTPREDIKGFKRKSPGKVPNAGAEKEWLFGGHPTKTTTNVKRSRTSEGGGEVDDHRSNNDRNTGKAISEVGSGMIKHRGLHPRLEMVSFKKLTKGTLTLGVVYKVCEHDMVVSLPSSLSGVVRRSEVSDYMYNRAMTKFTAHSGVAQVKDRYWNTSGEEEEPLTKIFKEGQVVRCAILSLVKDFNGRHIELSLRASVVNKGLSLTQLTQGSSIYGAVGSCEDHGYVISLGLEGVTAFLPLKNAPPEGLVPGQPLEAVIESVKVAARTLTLSVDPLAVSTAVTTGASFNLRSLKPGMLVKTTVDTVLPNGLLVNFLGYFAGCVDHNNVPVISGDTTDQGEWKSMYSQGMSVKARVLLVDYPNKIVRLTLRRHLLDMRGPEGLPMVGTVVDGTVTRIDPGLGLLLRARLNDCLVQVSAPNILAGEDTDAEVETKTVTEDTSSKSVESEKVIGTYVHISRLSDERVEHVEKLYKLGQKVQCRITGSSLVEGWSAGSLKASVLAASVIKYADLKPAMAVEGEIVAVEAFGVLVRLSNAVRALVTRHHLSEAGVKNPKKRFKVGSIIQGRVLTVESEESKATLTLKTSLVNDAERPITSYDEVRAQEGSKCVGFVTKIASFGLHVTFYNRVYGFLPEKSLARHGIDNPSEAFTVGQVIKCVVRDVNTRMDPPKLRLGLDVRGKTTSVGEDGTLAEVVEDVESDNDDNITCPYEPGQVVSGGKVASTASDFDTDDHFRGEKTVLVKLKGLGRGRFALLPLSHLADKASLGPTFAAGLTVGQKLGSALVIEVDRRGRPILSLKPLLLSVAAENDKNEENGLEQQTLGGNEEPKVEVCSEMTPSVTPTRSDDLSHGDVLSGFVSRVETFGIFIRFFGGFTALCPRVMAADGGADDLQAMFQEGDSIRCTVQRVDADQGRVVCTPRRSSVPQSPGLFVRSYLSEIPAEAATSSANGEKGKMPTWCNYVVGTTINAAVVAMKEYGVVLSSRPGNSSLGEGRGRETTDLDKGETLMVCSLALAQEGIKDGDEVKVRILGVDFEKQLLDVTMDPSHVKAGRSKRRRALTPPEEGSIVKVTVLLAKPDAAFVVAASSEGHLFAVQVADYNCPFYTVGDAGVALEQGQEISGRVRGCVGSLGKGPVGSNKEFNNPYAGLPLLVLPEIKRKKINRKRKLENTNDEDPTAPAAISTPVLNPMIDERVNLGDLKKNAKVVCEVQRVFDDHLDVKVAVNYPARQYALKMRLAKARRANVEVETNVDRRPEQDVSVTSCKDENDAKEKVTHKNNPTQMKGKGLIVKVYGSIHVTNAGPPEVDAPFDASEKDDAEMEMKMKVKSFVSRQAAAGADMISMQRPAWHPFSKFHIGQVLNAVVLNAEDSCEECSQVIHRHLHLACDWRYQKDVVKGEGVVEAESELVKEPPKWKGQSLPRVGEIHRGIVFRVVDNGVIVSLSKWVRGIVPIGNLSENKAVMDNHISYFKHGMGARVVVKKVDTKKKFLLLDIEAASGAEEYPDSELPVMLKRVSFTSDGGPQVNGVGTDVVLPRPGDVVEGKVRLRTEKDMGQAFLAVDLAGGVIGRVCITELADLGAKWQDHPLRRYEDGQKVYCRVLKHSSSSSKNKVSSEGNLPIVNLSLRPSRLDTEMRAEEVAVPTMRPGVDEVVKGYVTSTKNSRCWVQLPGETTGMVLYRDLDDHFVKDAEDLFFPGKLVTGKVLSVNEDTGRVNLTLKPSVVSPESWNGITWTSPLLDKGLKAKGRVAEVKEFGVIVQLDKSMVLGLCHQNEIEEGENFKEIYSRGDLVKVFVLKVEKEKRRLRLSMKPSYFEGDETSSEEGESEDEDRTESEYEVQEDGAHESDEDISVEDFDDKEGMGNGSSGVGSVNEDSDSDREEEISGVFGVGEGMQSPVAGAGVFGLTFDGFGDTSRGGEEESSDDESEDEDLQEGGRTHKARRKAREKREKEEKIRTKEEALVQGDAHPETAGDFDRLLVASPNSSFLWVKFMAFNLSLADVDGARSVCERGLKCVSFREEQERHNLWVAFLNLEHDYGTREGLAKVFRRACQNTNPKKVHLHLAQMHEKTGEKSEAEEAYKAASKKFRQSKKVWMAYHLSRLKQGDDEGARELLQRSLQSLGRHKHIAVITRFALNEYEYGSLERGRSIFEGLMGSYPKRLDLWNVYLDKEIKTGDKRGARNLFERMTMTETVDFDGREIAQKETCGDDHSMLERTSVHHLRMMPIAIILERMLFQPTKERYNRYRGHWCLP